jgi:hypothetical protein
VSLTFADRRPEALKIVFHQCRQGLQQDKPAIIGGARRSKRFKRREGGRFRRPIDTLTGGIKHQDDAPSFGKWQSADDRRRARRSAPAAINDEAARSEETNAQPGPRPPAETHRIALHIEGTVMESAQPGRHRERDLGPRAESGMGRHHFVHRHAMGVSQPQMGEHRCNMVCGPRALRSRDLSLRRSRDRDLGLKLANGEPDAAKSPSRTARKIEKTEVKPSRNRHRHGGGKERSPQIQAVPPYVFRPTGFLIR